jgi:hypothetical protein
MADIRLHRMAQVLVRYSLGIKKGDRLGIVTGPAPAFPKPVVSTNRRCTGTWCAICVVGARFVLMANCSVRMASLLSDFFGGLAWRELASIHLARFHLY